MRMLRDYGRVQLINVQNNRLKFAAQESSWPETLSQMCWHEGRVCYVVALAVIAVICFSSSKNILLELLVVHCRVSARSSRLNGFCFRQKTEVITRNIKFCR